MPKLRRVHIQRAVLKMKYGSVKNNHWFQEIGTKILQACQLTNEVQFNLCICNAIMINENKNRDITTLMHDVVLEDKIPLLVFYFIFIYLFIYTMFKEGNTN